MITKSEQKCRREYLCETCDYKCFNKTHYTKHLLTAKHENRYKMVTNDYKGVPNANTCECGKTYKHRQGLYAHKKVCVQNNIIEPAPDVGNTDISTLVFELLKSNNNLQQQNQEFQRQSQEFQRQLLEICKNGTTNITTNNNNQAFNINFFLNDTCKDAINFTDFINSLTVSREELMNTGNVGFVDGVSKILIDTLKKLGIHERPIHCTDLKREIMYIKDDNKWNKEDTDKKVRDAIATITIQSMKTLHEWKETNPDYKDKRSDFANQCIPMQMHSVAGPNRETYYPKIITAIAKEMMVDKSAKGRLT
jgi:hypothetical protein